MDASERHKSKQPSLFDQILPPRLEDAGLEDCALPPDSIREAFFKAASAVKSTATALLSPFDDSDGYCVEDPWSPTAALPTDIIAGILPERDPPAACGTEKGLKLPEFGRDEVVVGEMEERRGKGCCVVDVLEGLEIGDEDKKEKKKSSEEEKPILAEGFA